MAEVKTSSRVSPYIRFEQEKKLYRLALEMDGLNKSFDDNHVLKGLSGIIEVGEKVAILGANGIGKTTLLKCLMEQYDIDSGLIKWSENVNIGYYAQDHADWFKDKITVFEWMSQWKKPYHDDQAIRGVLGRMLFSQDDINKPVTILSGGEKGRMIFGKLILQRPNVLIMDEPTNHLDMESIEALNLALEQYDGTLLFVSHDREFVSSLASRIIELTDQGMRNFSGSYDDYLKQLM